jgi:hypothetical protein
LGDIDWNRIFAEGTVDGDDLHSGLSLTEEKQAPISFQIKNSASAREREEERRTSSRTVVVGGGGGEELGSEKRMWEMNEWLSGKWGSATPIRPDEGGLATPKLRRPPQIFCFFFLK